MLAAMPNSHPNPKLKRLLPDTLSKFAVPGALFIFGILNGSAGNPALVIVGVVSGIVALAYPFLNGKRRNKSVRAAFLLVLGALTFALIDLLAGPAHAQFFQNAQDFFTDTFTSSGDAIPIVFNTLRALYIVYLAVAFIGVFNAVRQDEDWLAAARTPILVVITVTLADILTGLITG
jgi:hypothetical protein